MALGRNILPLSTTIKSLPERALDQIQNRTPYLLHVYKTSRLGPGGLASFG